MGRQHCAMIAEEPQTRLCAVADPSDAGQAFTREQSVPGFDDHKLLLERIDPDAVIIANPNAQHVDTALDCLDAGVPALIEKPVGIDLESAALLVETHRREPTPLLVGHHRRHNPLIAKARVLVNDGLLGDMTNVSALWQAHKPDEYFNSPMRREPGNGMLHTNLIHDLDLLRYLCGEVTEVQAMGSRERRGLPYDDTLTVILRFGNGALGTLSASDTATAPWSWELTSGENSIYPLERDQPCYLLAGTDGALSLPQLKHWHHTNHPHWHTPMCAGQTPIPKTDAALSLQLQHFIAVARGEATPLVNVEDAACTLSLVDAIERSIATNRTTTPTQPWAA